MATTQPVKWLDELSSDDVAAVGGKNASLGEMIQKLKHDNIRVPDGFATTSHAYRRFLAEAGIVDKITSKLDELKKDGSNLEKIGKSIRKRIRKQALPEETVAAVSEYYTELSRRYGEDNIDVAVRSSATAEDLPDASFAGQQETFLNISGIDDLLDAIVKCYASLFTDRAIAYREEKGFDHMKVALSVGVQKMVRADKAGSGVMFSIDTETGFDKVVVINAAWGLGENVVQGTVTPDEYVVFKPLLGDDSVKPIIKKEIGSKEKKMVYSKRGSNATRNTDTTKKEQRSAVLSDDEILTLARWAVAIERHYGQPMDMEWARDGESGNLFIVQARPETVQQQKTGTSMKRYRLRDSGETIVEGLSIGQAIAAGKAQIIADADDIDAFKDGSILVTTMTDPDWVPIMKKAAAIVTDHGGRTSHAAIVSRELGIPAVIGTEDATSAIKDGSKITVSCAEGDIGKVYQGALEFDEEDVDLESIPQTETGVKINLASRASAFRWWRLPIDGVGLARMEFIINNVIKIHPMALVKYDELSDKSARQKIKKLTASYDDKSEYFVDNLARGIATIAASQHPNEVIVRMSDFKTNEYADLIGGEQFEIDEANPMLGFRGASRYSNERYREGFALECRAIRKVREEIGFDNVSIMIPFCRTVEEADRVLEALAENGLGRGVGGLRVFVMAEIPSNIILADQFAQRFDGFSIGSNDLTQLVLGIDRDSDEMSDEFDERDPAVKRTIADLIETAHKHGVEVGICGQGPSDHPEFAEFLVREGIDSISLNPDSVVEVKRAIAELEARRND